MEYLAVYKDELGNKHTRKFFASHLTQATRKALGIGKSHKWKFVSIGRI